MSNKNCKVEEVVIDCGCGNEPLKTNIQCDDFASCEENPCQEVFNEDCILYYGDNIKEQNISKGDSVTEIIEKLMLLANPNLSDTDSVIKFKSIKIAKRTMTFEWYENNPLMFGYIIELKEVVSGNSFISPMMAPNELKYDIKFESLIPGLEYEAVVHAHYSDPLVLPVAVPPVDSLTLLVKTLY